MDRCDPERPQIEFDSLLKSALPVTEGWSNWRNSGSQRKLVLKGILNPIRIVYPTLSLNRLVCWYRSILEPLRSSTYEDVAFAIGYVNSWHFTFNATFCKLDRVHSKAGLAFTRAWKWPLVFIKFEVYVLWGRYGI